MKCLKLFFTIIILLTVTIPLFALPSIGIYSTEFDDRYIYDIFIDNPISHPDEFRRLCIILKNALETDTVNFYINTDGGNLFACLQLCIFIRESKAFTKAHVVKGYSAGAMIAFACKLILMDNHSVFLIHSFKKYDEEQRSIIAIDNELEFFKNLNKKVIHDFFGFILTEKEIKDILEYGKDVYISGLEMRRRFEKKSKK